MALPLTCVLVALAAQQFFLFAADLTGVRTLDWKPFLGVSMAAAVCALGCAALVLTRRGRASVRESALRPRRLRELEAVWRGFAWQTGQASNQTTVLDTGVPLRVDDVDEEREVPMPIARRLGARSVLVVPLKHEGRASATLTFFRLGTPRAFDGASVALAEVIASEAATLIERTRLREVVAEERGRAARVLAQVGDGVFLADRDGLIRVWNPAAAAMTGVPAGAAVGKRPEDAIPGWATIAPLVGIATSRVRPRASRPSRSSSAAANAGSRSPPSARRKGRYTPFAT